MQALQNYYSPILWWEYETSSQSKKHFILVLERHWSLILWLHRSNLWYNINIDCYLIQLSLQQLTLLLPSYEKDQAELWILSTSHVFRAENTPEVKDQCEIQFNIKTNPAWEANITTSSIYIDHKSPRFKGRNENRLKKMECKWCNIQYMFEEPLHGVME